MSRIARAGTPWIIVGAVVVAIAANLALYGIGRLAGGTFVFTSPAGPIEVVALTIAGFSAIPLALGLIVVAVLGRWWRWVFPAALVIAPLLEVITIFVMTLPAGLDTASTIALSCCHLTLVPVTVLAILALRTRASSVRTNG